MTITRTVDPSEINITVMSRLYIKFATIRIMGWVNDYKFPNKSDKYYTDSNINIFKYKYKTLKRYGIKEY